ncbi:MAG TPA: hypothetical protein VMP86_09500 [Candidatus Binatia bacterium]|nr:hypothetical protein [Candidatus Binatia bacterium]
MTDVPDAQGRSPGMGPEQGGEPPDLMPWTLVVDGEDWSADLEHGAPLPRTGDRIDYIAEDGSQRTFRVKEIVHTLQGSASERPPVAEERSGPNSTVDRAIGPPRELRAGLPRVVVTPEP